jgi:hypothetical protein
VKKAAIGGILAGVAAVIIIGVFVGVGENKAGQPIEYQRELEESVTSESAQSSPEEPIEYERELEESVTSESTPPGQAPVPVQPINQNNCDPSYPTLCIPPNSPDLDCIQMQIKDFPVLQPDPMGFDGDRDGIGCES